MPLPRLPDLSLDTWIRDQQQQFERTISSLGESLEWKDAVSDIESQVPADYPHPGGTDQWEEAARQQQEEEYRRQQAEDERRQAEENQRQYEAYLNEKMRLEQEEQANAQQDALLQQTQQAGIPSPDQALQEFEAVQPGQIPQPVQDFQSFAGQIESGQPPDWLAQGPTSPVQESAPPAAVSLSAPAPASQGIRRPYPIEPPPQVGDQAPPPIAEAPPEPPRQGIRRPYPVGSEPSPPPPLERPYWTPTAREQEGMGPAVGPTWAPEWIRQAAGVATKAMTGAARAEPQETITLPTGKELPVPGWAQQTVGSLGAAVEPVNAAQDYLSARADPQTWYFARDGIARTELAPEEYDRFQELSGAGADRRGRTSLTPTEAREYQVILDQVDTIYQAIKNDPDKLNDYAKASPGYEITRAATSLALGPAAGGVAARATTRGLGALGAGQRTARAAGYAADIAAQTAFDPTTPALQPIADIALRAPGAAIRATRGALGAAGRALEASAEEVPTAGRQLGSGVVPRQTSGIDSFFREDPRYGSGFYFTDQENPVPRGANLLPMHWASIGKENVDKINRVLGRNIIYEAKGHSVYEQLVDSFQGLDDPQWEANRVLHQAGFDGLEDLTVQGYVGGIGAGQGESAVQVFLFPEAIGREIGPRANVHPPESLEDSVRAETKDLDFADFNLGSGISPNFLSPARNAAGGALFGQFAEAEEARREGREFDPIEGLKKSAIVAGLATASGSRGVRRALGRGLQAVGTDVPGVQQLGSGVVPTSGNVKLMDMVQAIRQMKDAGATDEMVEQAERHLAQNTTLTLGAVQSLTRAATLPNVASARAAVAALPADPDQPHLPGMAPPRQRVRPPSEAQRAQTAYEEAREGVREGYQDERIPVTLAETEERAARLMKQDRAQFNKAFEDWGTRPAGEDAAQSQAFRTEAAGLKEFHLRAVEDLDLASRRLEEWYAANNVGDDVAERAKKLRDTEGDELQDLIDNQQASLQRVAAAEKDFEAMQKGEFKTTTSAGQVLRAAQQKTSSRKAYRQILRGRQWFEDLQERAADIQSMGDEMLPADWRRLEILAKKLAQAGDSKLLDELTSRDVREMEREGIQRLRKAKGATGTAAEAVKEETLAERYGRLARRFDEANAGGETDAAQILRQQMDDTVEEMKLQADENAIRILDRELPDAPTPEEGMKIIQKAIGDKIARRLNREALEAGEIRTGPGVGRPEPGTSGAVPEMDLSMRQWKDLQAMQRVFERRIDNALKAEKNRAVQLELRTLASDARHMMGRAANDPDFAPVVQEFRDRVEKVRAHPGSGQRTGERMAKILEDRYEDLLAERSFTNAAKDEIGMLQSRVRGVKVELDQVLANRNAPGAGARVKELLDDMNEIGNVGKLEADRQRERLLRMQLKDLAGNDSNVNQGRLRAALAQVKADDPETIRPILEAMKNPTWWENLREGSYIALLSSFKTAGRNAIAGGVQLAGMLGLHNPVEYLVTGGQSKGGIAALEEARKAIPEGARRAGAIWRHGPAADIARLGEGIPGQSVRREFLSEQPGFSGFMARRLHQMFTRPLEAADQMLGHMAYQGAVGREAQRLADRIYKTDPNLIGMTRTEAKDWILSDIWSYPDIIEKAGKIKDYTLLRSWGDSPPEKLLQGMAAWRDPGLNPSAGRLAGAIAMDFMVPFFQVTMNYGKQGLERTVLSPVLIGRGLAKMQKGQIAEGGDMVTKGAIGASSMMLASQLADFDLITDGGPKDPDDRIVWLKDHDPYSIWAFNHWESYENMPFAIPFAMMAGIKSAEKEALRTGTAKGNEPGTIVGLQAIGGAKAAFGAFTRQTFLQGISDQISLLTDENFNMGQAAQLGATIALRYGGGAGIAFGGGFLPTATGALNFLAVLGDRVERDAGRPSEFTLTGPNAIGENIGARIAARLPGLRNQLSERIDAYGQPTVNRQSLMDSWGIAAINPYYRGPSPLPNDPATKSLQELSVGRPAAPAKITLEGLDVPLTIREQREFDKAYGQAYRSILDRLEKSRAKEEAKTGVRPVYDAQFYIDLRDDARDMAVEDVLDLIPEEDLRRRLRRSAALEEAAPQR